MEVHEANQTDPDNSSSSSIDSCQIIHEYDPNKIPLFSSMAGVINIEKRTIVDFKLKVIILDSYSWRLVHQEDGVGLLRVLNREFKRRVLEEEEEEKEERRRLKGCGPKCVIF